MSKADYKNFQEMLRFWLEQTDNNIKDEGLKVKKFTKITESNTLEAKEKYTNPQFFEEYLDYKNFSIQINFFGTGRYKGERVNYVVWKNENDTSWWLNIIYNSDEQTIKVCYRNDVEKNDDHKNFKDYMVLREYDRGRTYSIDELSLNSKEPTEKLRDLFDYFTNMIFDAKSFVSAVNYKNDYSKVLLKSKNIIFRGAPGTGKTYLAKKIASDIVSTGETDNYCDLNNEQKNQIEFVQFHPSYDYTDFVEGLRPIFKDGTMSFELQDGIFKKFCEHSGDIDSEIRKDFDKSWDNYLNHIESLDEEKDFIDEDHFLRINANKNLNIFNRNKEKPAGTLVKESVYQLYLNPQKVTKKYRREFALKVINRLKEKFGLLDAYESINQKNFYKAWTNLINHLKNPDNERKYISETGYIEANSNGNLTVKYDSEGKGYSIIKEVEYDYYRSSNFKTTKVTPSDGRKIVKLLKEEFDLPDYQDSNYNKNYVFIIDEINRGEISKIFGELFFSIDPSYRGEKGAVSTQYANLHENPEKKFYIPENVYIIGTMNDIDRSVDSFDFAMRRRFRFINIKAEDTIEMLADLPNKEIAIAKMKALNEAIGKVDELNENYHIGASYFLKLADAEFSELWSDYLEPLLKDYIKGIPNESELMKEFKKAYDLASGDIDDPFED